MAGDKVQVKFKSEMLKKILKNFKHPGYVKVGILQSGGKIAREPAEGEEKAPIDNATLGTVHEFGSKKRNIPQRSFLRMPLEDDFDKELSKSAKDKGFCELMLKDPNAFLRELGHKAVKVVQQAFNNGGSSQTKWAPLNEDYAKTKNVNMILKETSQLHDSISFEVVEGN